MLETMANWHLERLEDTSEKEIQMMITMKRQMNTKKMINEITVQKVASP